MELYHIPLTIIKGNSPFGRNELKVNSSEFSRITMEKLFFRLQNNGELRKYVCFYLILIIVNNEIRIWLKLS